MCYIDIIHFLFLNLCQQLNLCIVAKQFGVPNELKKNAFDKSQMCSNYGLK